MRRAIAIRVKGDDAFSVEFVHTDPEVAMKVANRLTTLFIEEGAERREEQVEGTSRFIEAQLDEARKELEAREAALGQFKQRHMGTLPQELNSNLSTLQRLQIEQQTIAESLRAAEDRLSTLQAQGTVVDGQPTELGRLRVELEQLRGRYTDQHPDVQALAARVARLERAASSTPGAAPGSSLVAETRLEVQSLRARREETERRIAAIQGRVEHAPRTEQELATLTRDYQKLNENYQALLNKKLEAQMAEKLEKRWKGERFKIIDPADRPERPFSPNRLLYLGLGCGAGLALGLLLALGAEVLDRSVRTVGELEALFGQPVLATVSHVPAVAEMRLGGRR
jgi:polysaccharide chain length determinant protein (PEP-CTERM system associated)